MKAETAETTRRFHNLVAVTDSKGKRIPHLFTRGEKFYGVAYTHGKRKVQSLPSCLNGKGQPVMEEVRRYCAEFVKLVEAGDWTALAATRKRVERKYATIGELCQAYQAGSQLRGEPRAETVWVNCLALKYIVRKGLGLTEDAPVDGKTCDVLSSDLKRECWRVLAGTLPVQGPEWKSARRTMHSKESAACSVFKWREDDFRALHLAESIKGFVDLDLGTVPAVNYLPPPDEVCEATIAAGRALTGPLAVAWLLTYDLGLRCSEAAHARWSHVEWEDDGGKLWPKLRVGSDAESGHVSKSERCAATRVRWVQVPPRVLELLREYAPREVTLPATDGLDFILPDNGESGRRDFIGRTFAAWLRVVHPFWQQQRLAAHELRKLKGCYWRRRYGLDVCHDWLGHADYNTTIRYYAKLKGRQEPQMLDDADFVTRWKPKI